jgi:hypothetical protein
MKAVSVIDRVFMSRLWVGLLLIWNAVDDSSGLSIYFGTFEEIIAGDGLLSCG